MDYLDTVSELNYLTQIVIMLYEDPSEEEFSERRFHVELHFSPGAYGFFDVLPEIDPISFNVNNIRTVLPKSNREAAHSPPRNQTKSVSESSPPVELTMSSSLPHSETISNENRPVTVDKTTSPMYPERAHPRMIKQRSLSSKTIARSLAGLSSSRSSERTDSIDMLNSVGQNSSYSHSTGHLIKPKSFEDDETNLQQATLSHNHYNTVHCASPEKRGLTRPAISSIFSTRVINGAKSTPDLNKLLERKQAGLICSETAVVAPLETLNTNLNYKILDEFIGKFTDSTTKFSVVSTNDVSLNSQSPPILIPNSPMTNRFSVESVEHSNGNYINEKKSRMNFSKLQQQCFINTITELPERQFDEDR